MAGGGHRAVVQIDQCPAQGRPVGGRARTAAVQAVAARATGRGAAHAADAATALLRAVPVLLDYHHVVQDRSPDPAVFVDLLARALDTWAVSDLAGQDAVPAMVPQY